MKRDGLAELSKLMVRTLFLITLALLVLTGIVLSVAALLSGGMWNRPISSDGMGIVAALLIPLGIMGAVFISLFVFAQRRVRQHQHIRIVEHLAQAVKLHLPLPQIIKAAAQSESGGIRKSLLELERNIASGAPLGTCLRTALPSIPSRDVAMVQAGEQMGRLFPALEAVSKERLSRHRRTDVQALPVSFLMVFTLMFTGFVVTSVSIFIAPKFEKIFEDYGMAVPGWTLSVMHSSGMFVLLAVTMMVVLLALIACDFAALITEPREKATWWRTGLLHVLWYTPARGAMRDKAMADACFLLSQGAAAGMAMPDALDVAGDALGDHPFSTRLHRWSGRLRSGEPVQEAARQAGMPNLVCGMVGSSHGRDGMEEVMTFLQRYYAGKFSRVEVMLRAVAEPLITLATAVLVGWVVIGMFLPLVKLIRWCVMETGMF